MSNVVELFQERPLDDTRQFELERRAFLREGWIVSRRKDRASMPRLLAMWLENWARERFKAGKY